MKYKVTSKAHHTRSHLFLVRVWLEELGDDKTEWRGQVKHVMSREVRYFRDWTTLVEYLTAMLPGIAEPDSR
jgi:hypothetical protein